MGRSLTHKLIESHLAAGKAVVGEEIGLGVDQVLLTDTNGIQSWLQFEALGFQRGVPAQDVILELLRRLTVRGGTGKIFEYGGPGLASLLAAQRMTIANMGAELGLTTSVFPSDEVTRSFFTRLGRPDDWRPAAPDADAAYDDQIELDLSAIGPLVALPGSPDRVVPVEEVAGTVIEQVAVGSCTNGSWHDMASVADVLRGRRVHPSISFVLFPGSH